MVRFNSDLGDKESITSVCEKKNQKKDPWKKKLFESIYKQTKTIKNHKKNVQTYNSKHVQLNTTIAVMFVKRNTTLKFEIGIQNDN